MPKNTVCPKCGNNEFDAAGRCVSCGYQLPKAKKAKKK